MKKFYFTYGTSKNYPFRGGWTLIYAPNMSAAAQIFKACHPNPGDSELLNCCDYYTAEYFEKSSMYKDGNLDAFCHEVIGPISGSDMSEIKTITPEQLEKAKTAVECIAQALGEAWRSLKERFKKITSELRDALLHSLNNTKWWHLYKYSKKRRVRKKYRDKLMRLLLSKMRAIKEVNPVEIKGEVTI